MRTLDFMMMGTPDKLASPQIRFSPSGQDNDTAIDDVLFTYMQSDCLLVFNRQLNEDLASHDMSMLLPETMAWATLPHPPTNRAGCSTAVHNNRLYAIGGSNGLDCLASVDVFNLTTLSWSEMPSRMTCPRSLTAVTIFDNNLIIIGGINSSHKVQASVECCNLRTLTWRQLPEMTTNRARCSAVTNVSNNSVIILGGHNEKNNQLACGEIFSFDTGTWSPFPVPMQQPRRSFGMAIERNSLFVVGGIKANSNSTLAEVFDMSKGEWSTLPAAQLPVAFFHSCAAAINQGKLYVCFQNQAFVFDTATQLWTPLPVCAPGLLPSCFLIPFSG
jgi:N-acetylneuraminic acid mutarotase